MARPSAAGHTARAALARRLDAAVAGLDDPHQPLVVIDLDAVGANADDLRRRAGSTPIRVASKSIRVPEMLRRVLARPGFAGVLAYTLREALWLVEQGVTDDAMLGYPSVDRGALARLCGSETARAGITLMVDDPAQLDLVPRPAGVRVAIDVDAGWRHDRVGALAVGPKRSPLRSTADVVALAREILARGFHLRGVMTYEGQVAGVPDSVPTARVRSAVVRRLKTASLEQLAERRAAIADALSKVTDLELWNAGGSGDVAEAAADPVVTEVAAGSGLLVPALFDHYRSFEPRPAAFFGVPVVRRPGPGVVTVAGGGFVASGAAGPDRLPLPWAPPGLSLTGLEGAGEVQTPLTGRAADALAIGDLVWLRHAKSGELMEHTDVVHLLRGERVEASVPTYRGWGLAW